MPTWSLRLLGLQLGSVGSEPPPLKTVSNSTATLEAIELPTKAVLQLVEPAGAGHDPRPSIPPWLPTAPNPRGSFWMTKVMPSPAPEPRLNSKDVLNGAYRPTGRV